MQLHCQENLKSNVPCITVDQLYIYNFSDPLCYKSDGVGLG
jgi:hypothetical protein